MVLRLAARRRLGPDARLGWYVIIGTIPIGVLGLVFKDEIRTGARNLWLIAIAILALLGVAAALEHGQRRVRQQALERQSRCTSVNPYTATCGHSYFRDLRGTEPDGMYDMLVRVVEKPLLDVVMTRAEGNQSKAAQWLGLNRNTLRKKLVEHKLLK